MSKHTDTVETGGLPLVSDADMRDKVHLLRVWPADLPRDDDSSILWVKKLVEELPAFLAHCLQLEVPAALAEKRQRFGHEAFKHPELLARLNSFSPELHLLGLIDQLMFASDDPYADQWEPWEGPAEKLRTKLVELANGRVTIEREITDLLKSAEQCGQYLARLMDHHPERVEKPPRLGASRGWRILPPSLQRES